MATGAFTGLRSGFTQLGEVSSNEAAQRALKAAQAASRRVALLIRLADVRNLDIFGYYPLYSFPGYRSNTGAWMSVVLAVGVALRVVTTLADFASPTPIINENLVLFPRDMTQLFPLPQFGLVFKRTGWEPFYDPNYFTFKFEQGYSGRASNSTYIDLGNAACSFVDPHGRIIEDEARCPATSSTDRELQPHVVGNFFDTSFRFVRITMLRCHNGTDADGRTQGGSCRTPAEIDELIYAGTLTLGIAQADLDADSTDPFQNLLTFKRQFIRNVHPTYDTYFTVRSVREAPNSFFDEQPTATNCYLPLPTAPLPLPTASYRHVPPRTVPTPHRSFWQEPRAFFNELTPNYGNREFVIYERTESSFTDFRSERIGRWNQPDPDFVPQYASYFLLLSQARHRATHSIACHEGCSRTCIRATAVTRKHVTTLTITCDGHYIRRTHRRRRCSSRALSAPSSVTYR